MKATVTLLLEVGTVELLAVACEQLTSVTVRNAFGGMLGEGIIVAFVPQHHEPIEITTDQKVVRKRRPWSLEARQRASARWAARREAKAAAASTTANE